MLSENEPCVRNTMPDCSNLERTRATWRSLGVAPTSTTASGALSLVCTANIAPYSAATSNGVATSPTSQVSARLKYAKKICWW